MKNLTSQPLMVQRQNGTRFTLEPSEQIPTLTVEPARILGVLMGVEIHRDVAKSVNFDAVVLNKADSPFIVSRDIFDALPVDAVDFITPDFGESAIRNAYKQVYAITRFIAKPIAQEVVLIEPLPTFQDITSQSTAINQQ